MSSNFDSASELLKKDLKKKTVWGDSHICEHSMNCLFGRKFGSSFLGSPQYSRISLSRLFTAIYKVSQKREFPGHGYKV